MSSPSGRSLVDLPCRVCVFFDPFGADLLSVEIEGQEPHYLDPNSLWFGWGFSVERDASGNARPPFFAPAPAAGRSSLFDADGTRTFFEKVWRDHGRDGHVVGVLEGGKVVVASGELLLVVPSWCVMLLEDEAKGVAASDPVVEEVQDDADAEGEILDPDRQISLSREDVLGVTCPRRSCRAEPGYPCTSVNGSPRHPHPARWRVAMLRKKEDLAVTAFAKELNLHVMNEGRKAATNGISRSENPHGLSSPQEFARRTVWDAGWIYVAGPERLREETQQQKKALSALPVDPEAGYSIEPHGPEGQYALYLGRGPGSHGLNLCALSDFDAASKGETERQILVNVLNGGFSPTPSRYSLRKVSTEGRDRYALFREGPPLDRLCSIWDFDKNGDETRKKLLEALNRQPPGVHRPVDPLSVDCPLRICRAKPGEPCRKVLDNTPRIEPHPARVQAADLSRWLEALKEGS